MEILRFLKYLKMVLKYMSKLELAAFAGYPKY